jgi:hypothetical protein
MSATTEPKSDAPRGQGRIEAALDAFDAAESPETPAAERRPAPSEQPATPAAEDEGRTTPPRDERGRFVAGQPPETPPVGDQTPTQAPAGESPPATPAQPDEVATLREEMRQLQSRLGNYDQMRQENQALRQQLTQGEQAWRQRQDQAVAEQRRRQTDDLNQRLVAAMARGDLTEQDAEIHRRVLRGQFAEEDNARLQTENQELRQGRDTERSGDRARYQDALLPFVLPQVMQAYVPQFAARASALRGVAITPEEAAAFLSEPGSRQAYEQAWRMPLPPGVKEQYFESIEQQQAGLLAERSRLAAERREWETQRELTGNRARVAGDGATRELVPGAAGEPAPDYSKYRNSGDIAGALDAYEEDRQAGRAQ